MSGAASANVNFSSITFTIFIVAAVDSVTFNRQAMSWSLIAISWMVNRTVETSATGHIFSGGLLTLHNNSLLAAAVVLVMATIFYRTFQICHIIISFSKHLHRIYPNKYSMNQK